MPFECESSASMDAELAGLAPGRVASAGWGDGAEEAEGVLEQLHALAESGSDSGSNDNG